MLKKSVRQKYTLTAQIRSGRIELHEAVSYLHFEISPILFP